MVAKIRTDQQIHSMLKFINRTEPDPPEVRIGMDDVAALQYTGGTTGVSKGAMLTHRNLSCNVQQAGAWFTNLKRGKEVWLSSLPFFHAFGMTVCMNVPVYAGCGMVLIPNGADYPQLIQSIARHRVTVFPGVPAQFNAVSNRRGIEKLDLSSVKFCVCGAAPLSEKCATSSSG